MGIDDESKWKLGHTEADDFTIGGEGIDQAEGRNGSATTLVPSARALSLAGEGLMLPVPASLPSRGSISCRPRSFRQISAGDSYQTTTTINPLQEMHLTSFTRLSASVLHAEG